MSLLLRRRGILRPVATGGGGGNGGVEFDYGVDPALVGPANEPATTVGTQATTSNYQTVIPAAGSGETVLLRAGTYGANVNIPAGVTVKPYNGETVNISGRWDPAGNNVTIAGLRFDAGAGGQFCIRILRNTSTALSGTEIRYCRLRGGFTNNIRLERNVTNIRIHHCDIASSAANHNIHSFDSGGSWGPANVEIDHNVFGQIFEEDNIQAEGWGGYHNVHHNNFNGPAGEEAIDIKPPKGSATFDYKNNYINASQMIRAFKLQGGANANIVYHENWVSGMGGDIGGGSGANTPVNFQWNIVTGIKGAHPGQLTMRDTDDAIISHNLLRGVAAGGLFQSGNNSSESNTNALISHNRIETFDEYRETASLTVVGGSTNNEFSNVADKSKWIAEGILEGTSSGYPTIPSTPPGG